MKILKRSAVTLVVVFGVLAIISNILSIIMKDIEIVHYYCFSTLSTIISLLFSITSLLIVFFTLVNNSYISKRKTKQFAKNIAEKIIKFQPNYIVMVSGNASNFYENCISKYIKYPCLNPRVIYFYPEDRFSTNAITFTSYTPTFHLVTQQFYLSCSYDICAFKPNDKILFFDDVIKSGDTIIKIKEYILRLNPSLSFENCYSIGLVADRQIRLTRQIDVIEKVCDLQTDVDYWWREK